MTGLRGKPLLGVVAAALLGASGGIGGYTFVYARGASYLGNDPATCANCHVMQGHFDAWLKSSHRAVAGCNDCHTPHGFAGKYATKARNGLLHSIAFTSGRFPEPLRIKAANLEIAEESCRRCHASLVAAIDQPFTGGHAGGGGLSPAETGTGSGTDGRLSCTNCHRHVGHPR